MMKWARALAAVAAVLGLAPVVAAGSASVEDPVEGYEVDVTGATHGHGGRGIVVHDIETTAESTPDYAELKLRLIGVEGWDKRWIEMGAALEGPLRGTVITRRGRILGHAFVWRPDDTTLRVEFARALLDGATGYRWSARLLQPCDDEATCEPQWDRVPDEGSVLHQLR